MMKLTKKYPTGQVLLLSMVLVLFVFLGAGSLLTFSFERVLTEQRLSRIEDARQVAEAGLDKAIFEINAQGSSYSGETFTIGPGTTIITITNNDDGSKTLTSVATVQDQTLTARVKVSSSPTTDHASFFYAIQVGSGGIKFKNNATVIGNVVSDGSLEGANGASISQSTSVSGTGNSISNLTIGTDAYVHTLTGSVVGQDARTIGITESTIGRDAYAASINKSTIGRDAYANSITRSSVGGNTYSGSGITPPTPVPFPLTDEQMDSWETDAAAGGTVPSYTLGNNQSATLGPIKVDGDLVIDNGATLTITGTIWVTGTITIENGATLQLDPGYGATSGIIVASNPNQPSSKGKVVIENNVTVNGSGEPTSNILVLSRLEGTSDVAIDAANNSSSMTLYAPLGKVVVHNNFIINSVTAYQLELQNNAQIVYNSGIASSEFAAGPGGAWQILSGTVEIL